MTKSLKERFIAKEFVGELSMGTMIIAGPVLLAVLLTLVVEPGSALREHNVAHKKRFGLFPILTDEGRAHMESLGYAERTNIYSSPAFANLLLGMFFVGMAMLRVATHGKVGPILLVLYTAVFLLFLAPVYHFRRRLSTIVLPALTCLLIILSIWLGGPKVLALMDHMHASSAEQAPGENLTQASQTLGITDLSTYPALMAAFVALSACAVCLFLPELVGNHVRQFAGERRYTSVVKMWRVVREVGTWATAMRLLMLDVQLLLGAVAPALRGFAIAFLRPLLAPLFSQLHIQ